MGSTVLIVVVYWSVAPVNAGLAKPQSNDQTCGLL